MLFQQLPGPVLDLEAAAVRSDAGLSEKIEFLDPLLPLFVQFVHGLVTRSLVSCPIRCYQNPFALSLSKGVYFEAVPSMVRQACPELIEWLPMNGFS